MKGVHGMGGVMRAWLNLTINGHAGENRTLAGDNQPSAKGGHWISAQEDSLPFPLRSRSTHLLTALRTAPFTPLLSLSFVSFHISMFCATCFRLSVLAHLSLAFPFGSISSSPCIGHTHTHTHDAVAHRLWLCGHTTSGLHTSWSLTGQEVTRSHVSCAVLPVVYNIYTHSIQN